MRCNLSIMDINVAKAYCLSEFLSQVYVFEVGGKQLYSYWVICGHLNDSPVVFSFLDRNNTTNIPQDSECPPIPYAQWKSFPSWNKIASYFLIRFWYRVLTLWLWLWDRKIFIYLCGDNWQHGIQNRTWLDFQDNQ